MKGNIELLRSFLADTCLEAIMVPSTDEWNNEYTPLASRRLEWLTGFSGSNGVAFIGEKHNIFFTDSRYLLQARHELGESWVICDMHTSNCWDALRFFADAVLGFDPKLHTLRELERYQVIAARYSTTLQPLDANPIDQIRQIEQSMPQPAYIMTAEYSGENSINKINRVKNKITADCSSNPPDYFLFTNPDSVCWLLNIRGHDVPYTPFLLCYLLLDVSNKTHILFVDQRKIGADITKYLNDLNVKIEDIEQLDSVFTQLLKTKKIATDPRKTSAWFFILAQNFRHNLIQHHDPLELFKAIKNPTEQEGIRLAHLHDGVALHKFFAWLKTSESSCLSNHRANFNDTTIKKITEISATEKLLEFRSKSPDFMYNSFATISGFNNNGAIVHYRANEKTDKTIIGGNGLYLLDSGGQYKHGTTDVTRTIAIGSPTSQQKQHFTAVLRGHIMLAAALFPHGTTGGQLDILARYHLWQLGLNYGHGTGHGVGHVLSVHEGPHAISKNSNVALEPGMVVSIEPGFYLEGEYGIRCENLYCIQKISCSIKMNATKIQNKNGEYGDFLCFEPLTLAKFDDNLINNHDMSDFELEWLRNYHDYVDSKLQDLV